VLLEVVAHAAAPSAKSVGFGVSASESGGSSGLSLQSFLTIWEVWLLNIIILIFHLSSLQFPN
jgi:hypothetical protein